MELSWIVILGLTFVGLLLSTLVGFGGSLVLVATLVVFFDPRVAVAMSAPVMLIHSLGKLLIFYRAIDWKAVGWMLIGTLPGAWLGAYGLLALPTAVLQQAVGGFLLLGIVLGLVLPRFRRADRRADQQIKLGERGLLGMSFLYGSLSGVTGTGGPLKAFALSSYGLTGSCFVGTAAVLSCASAAVKIGVYQTADLVPAELQPLLLLLFINCACAIAIGRRILRVLSGQRFRWLVIAAITASSLHLILV